VFFAFGQRRQAAQYMATAVWKEWKAWAKLEEVP
jgi:hypothetical protein